jgi:hypothetical protein
MSLNTTPAVKTVVALGATACIAAAATIAPLSSVAAQDVVVPAQEVVTPAPLSAPLAIADAVVGRPAYRATLYPAYPGFPVSYYYDDTYIYVGPRRVALAEASDPSWLAYCSAKYRSFDPTTGTFLGYDGLRHPCT